MIYLNFLILKKNINILASGLQHPFGLDIYGSNVYWTDWESNSVEVADKISGKHRKTILSNTVDLMDIRVFHRERRNVQNPCSLNNGGCSDICLLNSQSYTCACSVGVKLTVSSKSQSLLSLLYFFC